MLLLPAGQPPVLELLSRRFWGLSPSRGNAIHGWAWLPLRRAKFHAGGRYLGCFRSKENEKLSCSQTHGWHAGTHGRSKINNPRKIMSCSSRLPIRERVKFKVACLVRQSLFGEALLYLADDCCLVSDNTRRSQLTFRLAWRREHSAVTATELLQPLDLACGTLFRSSCAIQTSSTNCSDDSWRDTVFGKHEHGALWLLICSALEQHLRAY